MLTILHKRTDVLISHIGCYIIFKTIALFDMVNKSKIMLSKSINLFSLNL